MNDQNRKSLNQYYKDIVYDASLYGVECEFIYTYKKLRRAGYSKLVSMNIARNEWDI